MHKIKEMLMNKLYEYEEKAKKMPNGKVSPQELEEIHKLTDTVKNICKIDMLGDEEEEGGSYAMGSSYRRGRGRNARRDSMGRYSRDGGGYRDGGSYESGYSEAGNYMGEGRIYGTSYDGNTYRRSGMTNSYDGAKDHMVDKMEELMEMAETEQERKAIKKCIQQIENA